MQVLFVSSVRFFVWTYNYVLNNYHCKNLNEYMLQIIKVFLDVQDEFQPNQMKNKKLVGIKLSSEGQT